LIELGSHIEVEDVGLSGRRVLDSDERVDLEVGEVKVDVDRVETNDEVDKGFETFSSGNVLEEVGLDFLASREFSSDGNEKSESLGVDISDFYSSFVGEEDNVSLTNRVDADVVFRVGRVRAERFDDEGVESTGSLLDLWLRGLKVSSVVRDERRVASNLLERAFQHGQRSIACLLTIPY